jgi:hypothetical protein
MREALERCKYTLHFTMNVWVSAERVQARALVLTRRADGAQKPGRAYVLVQHRLKPERMGEARWCVLLRGVTVIGYRSSCVRADLKTPFEVPTVV